MPLEPAVGDKYLFTWAELGKPTVRTQVEMPGLGKILLDDADVHYAKNNPETAAFYVRRSKALGEGMYVVVARVQPA
ncbi:hypothetical protein QPK87_05165 [Kamptonema cortianum]|nr:hypothetical protein [Geitlerinema splendidum]MDK3155966.1 hypothetical protein [Kamptonema cortianum]